MFVSMFNTSFMLTFHFDVGQIVRNRFEGELQAVDDIVGKFSDHLQNVFRKHLETRYVQLRIQLTHEKCSSFFHQNPKCNLSQHLLLCCCHNLEKYATREQFLNYKKPPVVTFKSPVATCDKWKQDWTKLSQKLILITALFRPLYHIIPF